MFAWMPSGMEADRSLTDKLGNVWRGEIGSIKALKNCFSSVRRGGMVTVLGVYGMPYDNFPSGQIFDKGIMMAFRPGAGAEVYRYLIGHLER